MAGSYIEGVSKVLSGVYSLIVAAIVAVTMGTRGVVAYCFTSDWGPINSLQDVTTQTDFISLFNAEKTALTASKVNKHGYRGKPQKVKAYRMATGAAAKGTCAINDSAAALSLEVKTLYESARAFVAVITDAVGGGKQIDFNEGGVLIYRAIGTTVAALETSINASDYFRVTNKGANLPANSAGVNFVGGNNGDVVTATEYSAFLTAVEADGDANALALDGVSDEAILTVVETWVKRVRGEGIYITWVRGGPVGWDTTIADADTKSKAINHRGVVNVGNGVDSFTAAEMAIYIAARVASVALNRTLTDELAADYLAVNKKLTPSQRETCKKAGTLVFIEKGGKVYIDEGVNTLTVPGENEVGEMGKIRVNNTLDYITKDLEAFGDAYKTTRSNTAEARETYAATVENTYLRPLVALDVIRDGYYYKPDPDYYGKTATKTAKIDEAFFVADITPIDSMERIYQKIGVNF